MAELSSLASYGQRKFYIHRIDVWRQAETIDPDTGKVGLPVWTKVLSDLPCMWQTGESQQSPMDTGPMDEDDNLFTLDDLRTEAGVDIRVGDTVYQIAGPDTGQYFTVRGNPQVRLRLNFQRMNCSRTPKAPEGVG